MPSRARTLVVIVVAAALVVVFLHNVDLWGVVREIMQAKPEWLAVSLVTMVVNLAVRAIRWQYLLEPLGAVPFGAAFRATAIGFAASTVLPARAGEVIRPYFLARQGSMSATGAFATVILERLLDVVTVLGLLASFVFFFGRDLTEANPVVFTRVKLPANRRCGCLLGLVVLFVLAGDPARLGRTMTRLEQGLAVEACRPHRAHRREVCQGARRDSASKPPSGSPCVVGSALAVDCGRHLGGRGRVSAGSAFHRVVPAARRPDAGGRRPDAWRRWRLSRGVQTRRHDLLRRAGRSRGRSGNCAARPDGRPVALVRVVLRGTGGVEPVADA